MKLNLDYKMILSIITVLVSHLKQFPSRSLIISSTTEKFSKLVVGSVYNMQFVRWIVSTHG